MCGRYTFRKDTPEYYERVLNAQFPGIMGVMPRYNIAPGQENSVIHISPQGSTWNYFWWGLVPHWSKSPTTKYSTINAKVETIAEKPFYRNAYKSRRCLVPADGYYEWKPVAGKRQPYFIHTGQPFAFAGLWDHWEGEEADPFDSYTIITGPAAETVRDIHARMPLILPESAWQEWIEPETGPKRLSEILNSPVTELESYPISTQVNNPRNQGPELVQPI